MTNPFQYFMPVQLIFGAGCAGRISGRITGRRVFVLCDPFLERSGAAQRLGGAIQCDEITYFSQIEPNPSCHTVDLAANMAREKKIDCVIGLGGGSSLDVAKIVASLINNEGSIFDYYAGGSRTLQSRTATLICIPTTAGTGSEVTNVGVFTDTATHKKLPMLHKNFWADLAFVDPELTSTLPPAVTASTGMDAFCHAIEAYWNKEAQPICDMLSMGALKLILENIKQAYACSTDQEARANMLFASLVAGISFSQTRTTGIHALSFPLTAEFGASHGTACAITLPAFIRRSKEQAEEKMTALAAYLGYSDIDVFAQAVENLLASLDMPVRLSQLGVSEADLESITKVGLQPNIMQLTPAKMDGRAVYSLLKSIL